jgi:hypothetical protein
LFLWVSFALVHAESIRIESLEGIEKRKKVCGDTRYNEYADFFATTLGVALTVKTLDFCIETKQDSSMLPENKIQLMKDYLSVHRNNLLESIQLSMNDLPKSYLKKIGILDDVLEIEKDYLNFRIHYNSMKPEPRSIGRHTFYIHASRSQYLEHEYRSLLQKITNDLVTPSEKKEAIVKFRSQLKYVSSDLEKMNAILPHIPIEVMGSIPNKEWFQSVNNQIKNNPHTSNKSKKNIQRLVTCLNKKQTSELYSYGGFFQDYDIPYNWNRKKSQELEEFTTAFAKSYFQSPIFEGRLEFLVGKCGGE